MKALTDLITSSLPDLFTGNSPRVKLSIMSDLFEVDPSSADGMASEPRPDDRIDTFPFDPAAPIGPYTLTQPPYPGPRLVGLTTEIGDRIHLKENEAIWDDVDSRTFNLALHANRELTGVTAVQVVYGVTSIFTKVKGAGTVIIKMDSTTPEDLEKAAALVLAVVELNRQHLIDVSTRTYGAGDYGAAIQLKTLIILKEASVSTSQRVMTVKADIEFKATRALREDEGKAIVRIRTPGRPLDPDRPVDIHIDVP